LLLTAAAAHSRPNDRAEESDAAREKFFIPESDHLTLLHVYQQWKNNGYRCAWRACVGLRCRCPAQALRGGECRMRGACACTRGQAPPSALALGGGQRRAWASRMKGLGGMA